MTDSIDDSELAGLDPFDLLDAEAERVERYFAGFSDDAPELQRPSRCEGWSVRDVLAHLLGTEAYFQACLNDKVGDLFAEAGAKGATDVNSFNDLGVRELEGVPLSELLSRWKASNADTRSRMRALGDGDIATSVGPYPNKWQSFHVAAELATHADDAYAPPGNRTWRVPFSRFALAESKPEAKITAADGRTRVEADGVSVEVDDFTLVEGVAGRLDDGSGLSPEQRSLLSTMP